MKFPESQLAHKYLDGLNGIEIGGSAHNPFGLNTLNVDLYPGIDTVFKLAEIELCGEALPVDIVAPGDQMPFPGKSYDFIISSHVIEHFYDPVAALLEWKRVAIHYIFIIIPHRQRTFDKDRELTTFSELLLRHTDRSLPVPSPNQHFSVFEPSNFLDLCFNLGFNVICLQDKDDKVGNGFSVVIEL